MMITSLFSLSTPAFFAFLEEVVEKLRVNREGDDTDGPACPPPLRDVVITPARLKTDPDAALILRRQAAHIRARGMIPLMLVWWCIGGMVSVH